MNLIQYLASEKAFGNCPSVRSRILGLAGFLENGVTPKLKNAGEMPGEPPIKVVINPGLSV